MDGRERRVLRERRESLMARLSFTKMHGTGNDYIYVNSAEMLHIDPARLARRLAARRTGIGSDGLILVCPSTVAACRMEMYNADGSRAEMCGNGIRCLAKYAYERGIARVNPMTVETDSGIKTLELEISGGRIAAVTVDMGAPTLDGPRIPVAAEGRVVNRDLTVNGATYQITCVSMGNPHCVVFQTGIDDLKLDAIGPAFEHHQFFPSRVNTEFVEVVSPGELRMRVWERGSGETLACGTGACASVVAGALTARTARQARVRLRGGDLEVTWGSDDHVRLRGEAVEVFEGVVET
jgi:diaminopimelate epimerase